MVIKLLLADDQALVRGAMGALLNLEPDLEVVAEVSSGDQVVDAAQASEAEVCVLDVQMPGLNGIEATAAVRAALPGVRVLIVTTFNRPGYLREALAAGASGFVVKDAPAEKLAEAVRRVHAGLRVIDPELATTSLLDGHNPLTEREQQVLRLALGGASIEKIAAKVFLSPGTVRNLMSSAIGKTKTSNRIEAAVKAQQHGWI